MGTFFLDSSAIVKRYFAESGHAWIHTLCNPEQGHDLYISQATLVEVVATICRKERERNITPTERDMLLHLFRQDSRDSYNIWPVTTDTYTAAGDLCRLHSLRAYDAIQLACALALRNDAAVRNAPTPVFVCADRTLLDITSIEGLRTENPNSYP